MFTLQRYLLKVWETSSCFTVSSCLYLPKVRGAFMSDGGCVQGPWLAYRMKQGTWCQHQPQPDLWAHLLHQPGTWVTSCPCVWAAWPWEMQQWPFPGEWTLFLMGVKQLERACPPSHCLVSLCGCHMGSVREKISVTGLPLPWQAILQLGLRRKPSHCSTPNRSWPTTDGSRQRGQNVFKCKAQLASPTSRCAT